MSRIVKEQLIPLNSELFNFGLVQFEGNLGDVLQLISDVRVPVIIATQVSNLKDQKPFISVGGDSENNADSVYLKAINHLKVGINKIADSLFRKAKDLDALRFRAPEKINAIITRLSKKYDCRTVNIDSVFNYVSPEGIVGNNLIVDHLHPSLSGYQLIGKIFFESMQSNGYLPSTDQIQVSDSVQNEIVINNFAFSHLDSIVSQIRLMGLLNDWPFVEKSDFSFIKKLKLNNFIDSLAFRIAIENMNWEKGHREAADWYLGKKDYQNFSKEFQVIVSQYPFKLSDYDYAASQLINVKLYDYAFSFLWKRYKESPDAFSAKWLGNINLSNGNANEAIKFLTESLQFDKSDPQVFYNLAGAYIQKQEFALALQSIDKCLSIKPDFPNAKVLRIQLNEILVQ